MSSLKPRETHPDSAAQRDSAVLDSLEIPIVIAPMAGGPTTPALVRAAAQHGAFSALAWGTIDIKGAAAQLAEIGNERYGVNLFAPQEALEPAELEAARALAPEGQLPEVDYSFGWEEKLSLALEAAHPPAVLWAMFGAFSPEQCQRIHAVGAEAWVSVTDPEAAVVAARQGADVLCVQGPEAGGHRGTVDFRAEPDWRPLAELVRAVHASLEAEGLERPLIAAGGIRDAAGVTAALQLPGVRAVSCGSAFLLAEEAGTSASNRELIAAGGRTVSTRAFSGRYARGLATAFSDAHGDLAPIYPFLNPILAPRRAQGDPEVAYCLVGIEPEKIRGGSAGEILHQLY
ncbi:nitronate monooxygenase [Corynebacterium lizhenjunii]|uniref:nitronate monooxygenase n=1 Tax=Corynebacterium lizhenjunii TaxID=2709394 RepID=UPI0013EE304F|nr:nitronate monooxygenase [Corynebacterium lizhenjunii]